MKGVGYFMRNHEPEANIKSSSNNAEFFETVMRVHRNLKRCAEIVNPNSYGRGQGRALQYIKDYDGLTAQQLANMLDIRPSSLTSRLRPLETDKLIRKVRDKKDARVVRLHITAKGNAALENRKSGQKKMATDFCDCLSPEEQVLFLDMCNRLSDNLAKIKEDDDKRKKEIMRMSIS